MQSRDRLLLEEALTPDILAIIRNAVGTKIMLRRQRCAESRPTDADHAYRLLLEGQAVLDELHLLVEDPVTYLCPVPDEP